MMKVRQSNFELLRIVAMLLVMVIHANVYGPLGMPSVQDAAECPLSAWMRCEMHGLSIVCVNVFVLLSGYFGIRLSLKRVLSFMFQLGFWRVASVAIICLAYGVGLQSIGLSTWIPWMPLKVVDLHFTFGGWFIGAYLGLMLLAPVLNAFVDKTETKRLGLYVVTFFLVEFFADWLFTSLDYFKGGFTVLPLIGLYLCGAWLRRDDCPLRGKTVGHWLSGYLLLATFSASVVFMALSLGHRCQYVAGLVARWFFPFTGPHAIIGSVLLFLAFSRMEFHSKVINWVAGSAFAVYLFHGALPLYKRTVQGLFVQHSGAGYLVRLMVFMAGVFVCAVLIDKVRAFLWKGIMWCVKKHGGGGK